MCARPHSAEAIENSSTEIVKSFTSPTRRASQPVSGIAIAEATEYDEITHVPSLVATPRLPEIVGTATFAIDVSRTSMNVPSARPIVSRARMPPVSGLGAGGSDGVLLAVIDIVGSPVRA